MDNKPRKPWIAGLLSLFQPGLGQIYNGEPGKACIFYGLSFLALLGMFLGVRNGFLLFMMASYFVFMCVYYVFAVTDAVRSARRYGGEYAPKVYNRVVVYIGVYLLVAFVNFSLASFIKSNFVQAYKIPAGSMEPTLMIGDHLLVDRSVAARSPKRGDVVVFVFPEDPRKDFVKRVVAVAGDRVEIRSKTLFVNGSQPVESYAVHKEADLIPAEMNPRDTMAPLVVPADSYFMLGDNRDRSYDSRFWGFVTRDKIKGIAKCLYWSWDKKTNSVRWDRIGREVR